MPNKLDSVKDRLKAKEYRLTPQREAILKVLIDHSEEHLSADELFWFVKQKNPEVGLATVYRMLDLLEELGILSKLDSGDGRSRYEMRSPEQKHYHHHFICLKCGNIIEFADDGLESLDSLEKSVADRHGFDVTDHCLKLYGFCKDCKGTTVPVRG